MRPVVLDLDGAVTAPEGSLVLDLRGWHDHLRFACPARALRDLGSCLRARLPAAHGTVFTGSGDFHHLTLPLVARAVAGRRGVEVVVFDNHPDNMRFPLAVHCGSWVSRAARMPEVEHVHVVGITSSDISLAHAWENRLRPLYAGRVSYWSLRVATGWARRLGLGGAIRSFGSPAGLLEAFLGRMAESTAPLYLSIDKDVLDREEVQTNWDQGLLRADDLVAAIAQLRGRLIGSDITGEISIADYPQRWKRLLSALDRQRVPTAAEIEAARERHHAINRRLLTAIAG